MQSQHFPQVSRALVWIAWICALGCLATFPAIAFADAGAVRASQRHGNRQITVFTDPTPLRVGPVDVGILVQDIDTGGAILGDAIDIDVRPLGNPSVAHKYRATNEAASNKLLQSAHFDLPCAGQCKFKINVQGPQDLAQIHFAADIAEPLPPWQELWPWFCWPFLIVVLFVVFRLRFS
jgi:hypothetical protein